VHIVGTDAAAVDADLIGGRLGCPTCGNSLKPWGHARDREIRHLDRTERRRFRRSTCHSCKQTHVLIPEDTLARRRDAVSVIGAALVAHTNGAGHRRIAEALGRPPSTVRNWLRRFGRQAQALREHFTRWAHVLDPSRGPVAPSPSTFGDAVDAAGVLGAVAVRRFGPRPPWSLVSVVTGGRLLANTSSPFPQPM
jgi:transposase-like protein